MVYGQAPHEPLRNGWQVQDSGSGACTLATKVDALGVEKPWVSVNLAISADGKISSVEKRGCGWTSTTDHARLLELRAGADALLVGKGTLIADQMTMTVPDTEKQPLRCIISRSGRLDPEHPIFRKSGGPIHLCVTENPDAALSGGTMHHQTLAEFLTTLATQFSVKHLHCEGGGDLVHALAELDAIDEFHLTIAGHTLFGGRSAPTVTGIPEKFLKNTRDFVVSAFSAAGGECFLSYRRARN